MKPKLVATPPRRSWSRVWRRSVGTIAALAVLLTAFVVARRGSSPERDWADIEAAIAQKRWDDLDARLTRWLRQRPGDGKALLRLGALRTEQKRGEEAKAAFLRVAQNDPSWAQAQTRLGELALQAGDLAAAEPCFRKAAAARPRALEPRRRLVYILTVEQRPEEARPVLWELYRLTHDPRHLLTMSGLATTTPDARDPSPELVRFLDRSPDDLVLRRAQGLRLLRLGRPADARPYLESTVAAFENDAVGRLSLAECLILLGDTKTIDAALGPEPDVRVEKARWWLLKGQAAELEGRGALAIECWRNAVTADPGNRVANYRLGQALAHGRDEPEAKRYLERAEGIRLREVNLILAMDHYLRGGRDAEVVERLATICRESGLLPEAKAWYEELIKIDPTRGSAQAALASLGDVGGPPAVPPLTPLSHPSLVATTAAPRRSEFAGLRFEAMSPKCGIDFQYQSGASGDLFIGDTMGGGVALFDADGDGWLDVYFINGCSLPVDPRKPAAPNRLYRNQRDGTFVDVTARAGVGGRGYGMGCAVGDYDGDGDDDLFVTGLGSTVLYRNRGNGTFEDVTETAGVTSTRWTTAAGFADFDGDGDLDLVAVAYVEADPRKVIHCKDPLGHPIHCPPGHYPPQLDHLFRNNGNGTFTDVSREAGLDAVNGPGLGLAIADLDGDQRLDLFIANDATPNFLFRNLGGLKFEEVGATSGVAYDGSGRATASMGVVADDLHGDGLIDLLHTNFVNESCTLLKNLGGGQFADVTAQAGLAAPSRDVTGFGAVGFDADNDGRIDLFLANGHVDDRPWEGRSMAQRPQLFANRGEGRFVAVAKSSAPYFEGTFVGRGAAAGDLDNDGRLDLVVVHRDAPAVVLWNTTKGGHWLGLQLRGTRSSRTPVGARVTYRATGHTMTRWLTTGTSYLAASDPRLWLGLGRATIVDRLEVRWPSGLEQSWTNLPADRVLFVEEGSDPVASPNALARRPIRGREAQSAAMQRDVSAGHPK